MGEAPRLTLKELGTPGAYKYESGIAPLLIPDSDFEIKTAMINLIERRKYSGGTNESPLNHLKEFEKYCNTIKEFLSRFFPQKKTAETRALIQSFKQRTSESLYEAWERYKDYQRECPRHVISTYQIIQIFYGGLSPQGRSSLDAGAGGPIMNKTVEEVVNVIDDVVRNYMDWQEIEIETTRENGSIDQLNAINNFSTLLSNLGKEVVSIKAKLENASSQAQILPSQFLGSDTSSYSNPLFASCCMIIKCLVCDLCGKNDHDASNFPNVPIYGCDEYDGNENEHVNYVDNNDFGPRFNVQKNVENRNYHNHESYDSYNQNSGYRNQVTQGFCGNHHNYGYNDQSHAQVYGDHNKVMIQGQGDNSYDQLSHSMSRLENVMVDKANKLNDYISSSNKMFHDMLTHGKMLETQIFQLANTSKENATLSSLPSQGIDLKEPSPIENEGDESPLDEEVAKEHVEKVKEKEKEVYKPKFPYPQKFNRHKLDEQFGKFIEMLKEIHLSIPFTEVLEQMLNYYKFLKEILSGKRDCNVVEQVGLGECCSAFIHDDLLPKMKEPGNFSIPCNINGKLFQNALCDLGASVSIMLYSVFKRLKIGELLPSNMTLQLSDSSIKFPKGRVEDVPLKIGDFTIPVDFIVLEIAEDDHIPIILGRPFLATSGALIDVKGGRITLGVGNNEESFELKPMHESLSIVKGIMCVNSPRSIDNVL
ncbi:uncharacterized protein LOC110713738 [Chenopodium quinoa]|uniref:uncharacterized protein LOC110713738 n=1 Tax=Chenopodium quinoa TaxID=63459 RepID=UPI000B784C0C|nr:uncharacterized protein LOC110713738 [Chenopodium quinoa]